MSRSRLRTSGVPPPCRGLTGIVTGDSIIAVEGRPVNKAADLSNILDDFKIGVPRRHAYKQLCGAHSQCSHMLQHSQILLMHSACGLWMVRTCNELIYCAGDKVTLLVRRGDSSQVGTNGHAFLQLIMRHALLSVHSAPVSKGAVCICSRGCRRCNYSWRHKLAAQHEQLMCVKHICSTEPDTLVVAPCGAARCDFIRVSCLAWTRKPPPWSPKHAALILFPCGACICVDITI